MKYGFLTSSRADFGILKPLIREFSRKGFDFEVIAFGAHCSKEHGNTIEEIREFTSAVIHAIDTFQTDDSSRGIAENYGNTAGAFASFWDNNLYDLVFFVGDRYEMLAAVSQGIFFSQKFGHFHGGEETRGAIDNVFRHGLTHFSSVHFTSTENYAERVRKLLGHDNGSVYCVGALSLDDVHEVELFSLQEFKSQFGIDLATPTILITLHPETGASDNGRANLHNMLSALSRIEGFQYLITQTNADEDGMYFREKLEAFSKENQQVTLVESLGKKGYFSALKYVAFLMGNTSSGLIEAPSFNKYTLNIGNRQEGRASGSSVLHIEGTEQAILEAVSKLDWKGQHQFENPYWQGGAVKKVMKVLSDG